MSDKKNQTGAKKVKKSNIPRNGPGRHMRNGTRKSRVNPDTNSPEVHLTHDYIPSRGTGQLPQFFPLAAPLFAVRIGRLADFHDFTVR